MNFLKNISIKHKHFIILCFVICGLVLTTLASVYEFGRIASLSNILLVKERLNVEVLSLRKHEKHFFARKETKYNESFQETAKKVHAHINELNKSLISEDLDGSQAKVLSDLVVQYNTTFQKLVALQLGLAWMLSLDFMDLYEMRFMA